MYPDIHRAVMIERVKDIQSKAKVDRRTRKVRRRRDPRAATPAPRVAWTS